MCRWQLFSHQPKKEAIMKSLIFLAFVFFTAFAPFVSSAQFPDGLFPPHSDDAEFSYLPYWASPLNAQANDEGFTPVTLAARPVMVRTPSVVEDSGESKVYRISETGAYEYRFTGDELMPVPKQGFKPITVRTFFLETSRLGIIPADVTYRDFIAMTADDQRALIDAREQAPLQEDDFEYAQATLTYQTAPGGMRMTIVNSEMQMELSFGMTPGIGEGKMVGIKYLPHTIPAPQMVMLLVDPWNNYQLNGHAYYKNINGVLDDLSSKVAQ